MDGGLNWKMDESYTNLKFQKSYFGNNSLKECLSVKQYLNVILVSIN